MSSIWIQRDFEEIIQQIAQTRPALVLTGARQTGKTSLLKRLFPSHHFVSLDLPTLAEQAEQNPQIFIKNHPPPVIIDEIQYAPKLFRYLKILIDENRSGKGQFILTGSQKFELMKEVTESLAGRVGIIEFDPLSMHELLQYDSSLNVDMLLLKGGFPELYAEQLDPASFYQSYVSSYLERDLRQLLNVGQLRDFERFLRACALRSGQLLNKSDLAKDVGISPSTANQWLSALDAANQVKLLEPWFSNQGKRMVKTPKLYLCDTGLLCFLLNIQTESELHRSPMIGQIWETFVFSQIRMRLNLLGRYRNLFFWRDRAKEVDFLYHQGGQYLLGEVKFTSHPDRSHLNGIKYVESVLGKENILGSYLFSRAEQQFSVEKNIINLPLQAINTLF